MSSEAPQSSEGRNETAIAQFKLWIEQQRAVVGQINKLIGEMQEKLSILEGTSSQSESETIPAPLSSSTVQVRISSEIELPSKEISDKKLINGVKKVLIAALGVDDDEIFMDARIKADLGAESIDYLDIRFRLEKEFGIKITGNDLFLAEIVNEHDVQLVEDRLVTEAGLEAISRRLPFADLSRFRIDPKIEYIEDFYTVGMLVRYLQDKFSDKKE